MAGHAALHENGVRPSRARTESEERLFTQLGQAGIRLQALLDSRFRALGVTAQEAALLIRCCEAKERSSTELAAGMSRDKGGITRHLHKLQAHGLIQRFHNPRDRRVTLIRATQRGRNLVPRCRQIFLQVRSSLLQDLFDVELHQLSTALSRVCAALAAFAPEEHRGLVIGKSSKLRTSLAPKR